MWNTKAPDFAHSLDKPAGQRDKRAFWFEAAVGMALVVLLHEWIKPIADMSGLSDSSVTMPLYAAVAFFILLDVLRIPVWAGIPLKTAAAVYAVGGLFADSSVSSWPGLRWMSEAGALGLTDLSLAFSGRWEEMSPEFRAFIFLAGWAILAGILYSLLLMIKRGLWLIALTLLYLIGLQLWPGVDTTQGIVNTTAAGIVLLAVLNRQSLLPKAKFPALWGVSVLILSSGFLFGAMVLAGDRSRTMEPLTADTMEHFADRLIHQGEYRPTAAARRISGFGEDDSVLGGSLRLSNDIVFTARTTGLTYWRGETKNVYTGKGWVKADGGPFPAEAVSDLARAETGETVTQELLYQGEHGADRLFAGGPILQISALIGESGRLLPEGALSFQPETSRYGLISGWGQIAYAKLTAAVPETNPVHLRAAGTDYPSAVKELGLQLPPELPERVKQLAQKLTAGSGNPYDKALRIQSYLKQNYRYSLTEAKIPRGDQDFVDAFLFEQRSGYCDYFSTAMTVLLRSAGVPARWAKGFAPGDPGEAGQQADFPVDHEALEAGGPVYTVTVRDKDAHSWVEVYFPGAGWVPFDPTPGFSGSFGGQNGGAQQDPALMTASQTAFSSDLASTGADVSWFTKGRITVAESISTLAGFGKDILQVLRRHLALGLIFSALAILLIWVQSKVKWPFILLLLLRRRGRGEKQHLWLQRLLDKLWQRIYTWYGPKLPEQTLREYALQAAEQEPQLRDLLVELALVYEEARYGKGSGPWIPKSRINSWWKALSKPPSRLKERDPGM